MTAEENSALNPDLWREKASISPEIRQILQQQTIEEERPGTILRDFQTLLDLLGIEGIEVSGVNSFLPMKLLAEINSRLTNPLLIDLKRPQQKSYANIHGLYLLLRSSGLAYVIRQGKKSKLVREETAFESWQQLNSTERYLTLLEIWLIWASDETLGEHSSHPNLLRCIQFEETIPKKGLKITKKNQGMFSFKYSPRMHNLALLELFGLIALEQGQPEKGKGWRLTRIQKTAFGSALLQMLHELMLVDWSWWSRLINPDSYGYTVLQPILQAYFPEWQNSLVIAEPEFREGIYQFKVSLPQAWRRLSIPSELTLEMLVNSILDAFNFDKDHLYQFICQDRFGTSLKISHPYMEDSPPWTDEFQVGELPLQVGETMSFWFDFGDDWKFKLLLEEIKPPNQKMKQPQLLESSGEAPQQYGFEDWEEEE